MPGIHLHYSTPRPKTEKTQAEREVQLNTMPIKQPLSSFKPREALKKRQSGLQTSHFNYSPCWLPRQVRLITMAGDREISQPGRRSAK